MDNFPAVEAVSAMVSGVPNNLPDAFTRAQAHSLGFTDRQIHYRVKKGIWRPVRKGIYSPTTVRPDLVRVAVAWKVNQDKGAVISHASAAFWWKLPEPNEPDGKVWLTCPSGFTRNRSGLRIQIAPLPPEDLHRSTVLVTSAARTVVDCARHLPPRDALAIGDNALSRRLCTLEQLEGVLAKQRGWPGIERARKVVALIDGRRESPLESWSAWTFHELGLPAPEWQQKIYTPEGRFVARVDALWPGGLIGEADGRGKYGSNEKDKQRAFDDEKRREGCLHDLGGDVLRWYAEDVLRPSRFPALRKRYLTLSARPRVFTGVVRQH